LKILLIRPNRNEADQAALETLGLETEIDSYLSINQVDNPAGATRMLEALSEPGQKWLLATSTNAVDFWQRQLPAGALEKAIADADDLRFGAIGLQTRSMLENLGASDVLIPQTNDGNSLASQLAEFEPGTVIQPAGSIAMKDIPNTLEPLGFEMITEVVYATEEVTETPASVERIKNGEFDAVLFRSPSAARAFLKFNPKPNLKLISAGNTTAKQISSLGYKADLIVEKPDPGSIATAVAEWSENA